jgi:DNA replicative helicase MCM subunit Mcm2 (Cdc46/Mcm family)
MQQKQEESLNEIRFKLNEMTKIKENLKISNSILSRFDLIFLILDKPDPDRD